jgi:hypothetical protein
MASTMDLIVDMMPDDNIIFESILPEQTNEYYQGHAEHILAHIDTPEHYFHFVNTILKDYHTLSKEQQKTIQDTMGIQPIIQERVVYKDKIVYKEKKKANLHMYDDY